MVNKREMIFGRWVGTESKNGDVFRCDGIARRMMRFCLLNGVLDHQLLRIAKLIPGYLGKDVLSIYIDLKLYFMLKYNSIMAFVVKTVYAPYTYS